MKTSLNLTWRLRIWTDSHGQDLIEYALVAGLIGLGAIVAMTGLSGKISNAFNSVGNSLTNAMS